MTSTIDALRIRARLGRREFSVPVPFGPDGWRYEGSDDRGPVRVIVTAGDAMPDDPEGGDWWHASIGRPDQMPTYEDLTRLHRAVWPDGHAVQCFVPPAEHVNIHAFVLHLWGRPDGRRWLPNFGAMGTI